MAVTPVRRSCGQRRIVPANGFYEWQVLETGKQPWFVHLIDRLVFGFAGLWDVSTAADGTAVESFAIITMPANPFMAGIHNEKARMPAILRHEDHDAWLSGDAGVARACLAPYAADRMAGHAVSTVVNSPKNNGPRLIEPLRARA